MSRRTTEKALKQGKMESAEFDVLNEAERQEIVDAGVKVYSDLVLDGSKFERIADEGHIFETKLVNCVFEDGTTKHVKLEELESRGIQSPFAIVE